MENILIGKEKENVVFRSRVIRSILIYLHKRSDRGDYVSGISKSLECCPNDIVKKVDLLNKVGLVEQVPIKKDKWKKDKRRRYLKLTSTGKDVVEHLLEIDSILIKIKSEDLIL